MLTSHRPRLRVRAAGRDLVLEPPASACDASASQADAGV